MEVEELAEEDGSGTISHPAMFCIPSQSAPFYVQEVGNRYQQHLHLEGNTMLIYVFTVSKTLLNV